MNASRAIESRTDAHPGSRRRGRRRRPILLSTPAAAVVLLASCAATGSTAAAAPPSSPPPDGARGAPVDRVYVYEVTDADAAVAPYTAQVADTLSTIQVSGRAELQVAADEAVLALAVETEAETASEASSANAERMEAVLAALREVDMGGLEIETFGYSLQPQYRRPDQTGAREIASYRATNMVRVTIPEAGRAGELIDAGVGAGANRVASLSFRASDTDEVRLEALRRAVGRARAEAETIAEAMGATLGRPLEVNGGADPVTPMRFERMEMQAAFDTATPVEPGSQTVSASVTIRYSLEP